MQISPLFPNFLAESDTREFINNKQILNFCNNLDGDNVPVNPNCAELAELTSWVTVQINELKTMQGLHDWVQPDLSGCWVNNIKPNAEKRSHPEFAHAHVNSWISFVYYVNYSNDAGSLVFMAPTQSLEYTIPRHYIKTSNIHNSARWMVLPYPGLAVAFPSWLIHYVEPNHSKDTRISIAYNFRLPHQVRPNND